MAPCLEPAETLVAEPDAFLGLSASRFAPGAGPTPPAHVHAEHTEAFLVLDGALRFVLESGETVAGAGTLVVVPPGVTHTFRAGGEMRFLDLHTPSSGYGTFVRALSAAGDEQDSRGRGRRSTSSRLPLRAVPTRRLW